MRQSDSGEVWRAVGTNAAIKMLVLGFSGVLAVITTGLIIDNYGLAVYAQYGLLTSLALLLPFGDLGMSSVILNTLGGSTNPRRDPVVRRTLVSVLRVLLVSGLSVATLGVLFWMTDLWPKLLGDGLAENGALAATLCVLAFSLAMPLAVGQRILTGLGKHHIRLILQALIAPFMLCAVGLFVLIDLEAGGFLPVLSYVGTLLVVSISMVVASRHLRPQLSHAIRDVPKLGTVRGRKVMNFAWPTLITTLVLPIAMQTDRLLLSHLSTTSELAQYNLASQLFGLILQTVAAAGVTLWPFFARARALGQITRPYTLTGAFALGFLALALCLAALTPLLARLISGGLIRLDFWLLVGFVLFVTAEATKYPLGMYMTDLAGLRFQVVPILVLVPLNLGLSWTLVAPLGAAGPIIGSAVSVLACQVLPSFWYVRRDLANRSRQRFDDRSGTLP